MYAPRVQRGCSVGVRYVPLTICNTFRCRIITNTFGLGLYILATFFPTPDQKAWLRFAGKFLLSRTRPNSSPSHTFSRCHTVRKSTFAVRIL